MARSPTSSRDRLYQSSRRHPRTYILSYLFQKTNFSNFFGPFSRAPGARRPNFRTPLLTPPTLGFFSASPALFTPATKRWSLTSNVTPTPTTSNVALHTDLLCPLMSPALNTVSTRPISYVYRGFTKALPFKNFRALSRGPLGSTPPFSDSPHRVTYPSIFSRLSTSFLTKGFTQALPTSTATPTPTPFSDPTPRFTYRTIFPSLSTSILTNGFTRALPTSNITPTPTPYSDSPPRVTHLGFFPASLPHF